MDSKLNKVLKFYKENKKEIMWLIIISIFLYFIFIFAEYWDVMEKGFQEGWQQNE
ncbi:MAG: hypothetical protein RSC28_07375 [Bacteroidales bacterium]